MTLAIALVAFAAVTALQVLKALAVSFGRDLAAWWRNRRPARGWQPKDHRPAPFWRTESGMIGGIIMGLVAYAALVGLVLILRRIS